MNRTMRSLLAVALALALAVALLAGDRNKFPGRRQGGGSRGQETVRLYANVDTIFPG